VNGITVDANGRADLATSTIFENQGRTTYSPGFNQVEPNGTNKPGWGYLVNGDMNGVALAPDGTWITVGNWKADGDAVQSTLAINEVNNIQGLDINADTNWGWVFTFAVDASANSVAIDNSGAYYYAGTISNGAGTDMLYIKNATLDGATQLDGLDIFIPGSNLVAYAITLDGAGNAYLAGTVDADGIIVQITGI